MSLSSIGPLLDPIRTVFTGDPEFVGSTVGFVALRDGTFLTISYFMEVHRWKKLVPTRDTTVMCQEQ